MVPTRPRPPLPTTAGSSAALALLVGLSAWAQPASEAEFVAQALAQGLAARSLDAELEIARARTVGAGAWPNPSLQWERQPNPTDDRVVGGQHLLTARVPLVVSGRLALEAGAAAAGAEAALARRSRGRAAIARSARLAWAELRAAGRKVATLAESRDAIDAVAKIVEAREKAGASAGYDRVRVALERAAVDDALLGAQGDEKVARLLALRLLAPGTKALPRLEEDLAAPAPVPSASALAAGLEGRRADLAALEREAESAARAARAAGRGWVPEPSLTAGALLLEGARPEAPVGLVVGVEVPLPFFDRRQGPAAQATAERRLFEAQRAERLHAARLELAAAHEALRTRTEQLVRHRADLLGPSRELVAIATAAYRGGSAEVLVLVDAERGAREAALRDVALCQELDAARAELLFAAGADDDLAPPAPTAAAAAPKEAP